MLLRVSFGILNLVVFLLLKILWQSRLALSDFLFLFFLEQLEKYPSLGLLFYFQGEYISPYWVGPLLGCSGFMLS